MEANSEILHWAGNFLKNNGHFIDTAPEEIQCTPYSSVYRFVSNNTFFYLKQMPAALALEPTIISLLQKNNASHLPEIIASNNKLKCFIMLDAGLPLRNYSPKHLHIGLFQHAIKIYSAIQSSTIDCIKDFLILGIPDWRVEKLPEIYVYLINEVPFIKNQFTQEEINLLNQSTAKLIRLCEKLNNYKIPATLDHCDFHDNNIFIDPKNEAMTIIDWAETSVTHPFFSVFKFLRLIEQHFSFSKEQIRQVKYTWLNQWTHFETQENLEEILQVAAELQPIYEALGYYRLVASLQLTLNYEQINLNFNAGRNKNRLSNYFRNFISQSDK